MRDKNELLRLDGLGQAELVKKGEVSAAELVELAIEQIEQRNPQLNAVVTKMADEARTVVAEGMSDGPFQGVPFLLKDLGLPYKGVRLTGGSAALANYVPEIDAELTRRIQAAGLVTVGKSNTPEFGLLPTTESIFLGACRNPWHLDHSPGGSSGGAAAAVAAGMVPLAHATDGGGSIRIPASCCGLFGLKPTRGRIPQGPNTGDTMSGLSIGGCVSRSVRDSAAFLDGVCGPDLGDPYVAPEQKRPFLTETTYAPSQLRIAFTTKAPTGAPVHEKHDA